MVTHGSRAVPPTALKTGAGGRGAVIKRAISFIVAFFLMAINVIIMFIIMMIMMIMFVGLGGEKLGCCRRRNTAM